MGDIASFMVRASEIDRLPKSPAPNLFTSQAWIKTILQQYDFKLICIRQANRQNYLAVAEINQFGIKKLKAFPFCDYIIPPVENANQLAELINHLKDEFRNVPIELKMILPSGMSREDLPFNLKHAAFRHTVDVSAGLQEIEDNMDNSFMRGVRKAKSNELTISLQKDEEALSKFYDVYCKQRIQKFKKLPQPFSFFEKIHSNFLNNDRGFILQATKGSTVIASMIILAHHKTLYYKFGCSVQKYLNLRPNNLLFYRLFKYAHENNFDTVGLGLSGVSEDYAGLVRFKEYMGGISSNIYSLRISPPDYDESAEKQLHAFTSSLTKTIVNQQPDKETADAFSEKLYPLFA